MSEWLALTIAMLCACMVVVLVAVVRKRQGHEDTSETPDVIEYMSMMIGVIYAVVLGLAIAGTWEIRSSARETVRAEAQSLHEAVIRAQVYPSERQAKVTGDIDAYVSYIVRQEWPTMVHSHTVPPQGEILLNHIRADVTPAYPVETADANAAQPVLDALAAADDARGARVQIADSAMPTVVWIGLGTGALITVLLVFLLQIRRTFRELLLAGLFSALVAFLLFLVWDFQSPFSHTFGVSYTAFTDLFPAVRE